MAERFSSPISPLVREIGARFYAANATLLPEEG